MEVAAAVRTVVTPGGRPAAERAADRGDAKKPILQPTPLIFPASLARNIGRADLANRPGSRDTKRSWDTALRTRIFRQQPHMAWGSVFERREFQTPKDSPGRPGDSQQAYFVKWLRVC
jgi:hypothetical protein